MAIFRSEVVLKCILICISILQFLGQVLTFFCLELLLINILWTFLKWKISSLEWDCLMVLHNASLNPGIRLWKNTMRISTWCFYCFLPGIGIYLGEKMLEEIGTNFSLFCRETQKGEEVNFQRDVSMKDTLVFRS